MNEKVATLNVYRAITAKVNTDVQVSIAKTRFMEEYKSRYLSNSICTVLSGRALDLKLNPPRSCGITEAGEITGNLMMNEAIPIPPHLLLFCSLSSLLT